MKNKKILTIMLAMFAVVITSCNGGSEAAGSLPTGISVVDANNAPVSKLVLEYEEQVQLSAVVTPSNSVQTVEWRTSNELVATISASGLLTGVGMGETIITVNSTEVSYISLQFFVEVKKEVKEVKQTGVGSGTSRFDPIFLGNEGEDEPLEVYVLETYNTYGDSLYLKKGNVDVIIDAGVRNDGQVNNAFIKEKVADGIIDLLILSHAHSDHYGGMRDLISGIDEVSVIIDHGIVSKVNDYETLVDELVATGTKYYPAIDCVNEENGAVGKFYLTEEFYVEILNTGQYVVSGSKGAENPASVAMMFNYRDFNFFTAGDLTSGSETTLMNNVDLPRVTLYKASHHCSNGSNSQRLLDTLDPKAVAIVSSRTGGGAGNQNNTSNLNGASGHPGHDAVGRLYQAPRIKQNRNVYWNGVNGTMRFTTYGEDDFEFQGSPTVKGYYDLTLTGGVPSWNPVLNDFDNKITGEENLKFHETKVFGFRGYESYLTN